MKRLAILVFAMILLLSSAAAEKTVTITFTGDVTIGSEEAKRRQETSFDSVLAREGYDYFLANVREFFAEDDLTVINLEGVLSDSSAQEEKKKTYRFRGPTDFIKVLTGSSVEACNLANNHTGDFGKQGLAATLQTVRDAGLAAFGTKETFVFEKDGVKIGFIGLNSTKFSGNQKWAKEQIATWRSEEGVNAVVFVVHVGTEYDMHHNRTQTSYAHTAIDIGADLVIMHHPHVVQGLEIYENRTICYSLGNFCFGGNRSVRAQECLVVRAELTFTDDGAYQGQQLSLYPAFISGTTDHNDFQPSLVKGEDAERVLHLAQIDTAYELAPYSEETGCAVQPFLPALTE